MLHHSIPSPHTRIAVRALPLAIITSGGDTVRTEDKQGKSRGWVAVIFACADASVMLMEARAPYTYR